MKSIKIRLLIVLFLLIILFFLDLSVGKVFIKPGLILHYLFHPDKSGYSLIVNHYRLQRALSALLIGGGLAISALILQNLFNNPLAGPYILGISSGAGFGVALFLMGSEFFYKQIDTNNFFSMTLFGFLGAVLVIFLLLLVYFKTYNLLTILIFGIMLSGIFSSFVSILQFFSQAFVLKRYMVWTMGSLENVSDYQIYMIALVLLFSSFFLWYYRREFDALYLAELSKTLGVNYRLFSIILLLIAALITGTITSFVGPIAFVGIISPHIGRMLTPSLLGKYLIPISILTGSFIMLFADIISHLPFWQGILPINSITSLIGIPIILYVLFSGQKFKF